MEGFIRGMRSKAEMRSGNACVNNMWITIYFFNVFFRTMYYICEVTYVYTYIDVCMCLFFHQ